MNKSAMIFDRNQVKIPLFRNISDAEFQEMWDYSCMRNVAFSKGTIIFHQGDVVHEMGIVLSGSVDIENIDLWGNKTILSNVTSGSVFAETYALCHEPMMVDAVASEDCEVLMVNMDALMDAKNGDKSWYNKFVSNMLRISMQKNLVLSNRIFCNTAKTIRSRVLTYLTSLSIKSGSTTVQVPFNRQQMADYLNLDRSALSKELGKMRDDGILEFYKNTFKLLGTIE